MHFPYSVQRDVPLFLAPMAGVSESPFRQICRRFGADVVVSEFISSVGISLGIDRVLADMRFEPIERPIGIQIYGADATVMAKAAGMVSDLFQPDFVDINFGCPVKKVVRNNGGSGCLKDMTLVRGIIQAVRQATQLPVTVKIRSGWDETQRDPVTIALQCQDAGAQVLTLHPRTRTQMYQGAADWDEIARVVDALDIAVVGNGYQDTRRRARHAQSHRMCGNNGCARFVRESVAVRAGARPALRPRQASRPQARGALCRCARARAPGVAAAGRYPQDGARIPQAPRLVHKGASRCHRIAPAAIHHRLHGAG